MNPNAIISNINVENARSVSSVFINLEKLVCELAPRSGQAMLGVRWSFALPEPGLRSELVEYSFPFGPVPFVETLATRGGLHIVKHDSSEAGMLLLHLDRGKPAIVVVDSFYLPYRPAFGRVHSHRTIIVRPGQHKEEVWVEDCWPPGYKGRLPTADLNRARYSLVPLDKKLEPIFAGRAIAGEWFGVEIIQHHIADVRVWGTQLLQLLHLEATTPASDEKGSYGIAAMRRFREELAEKLGSSNDAHFAFAREASLLLRAELSSRVFLCALLRAAAGWLEDARLKQEANIYYAGLRHLEMTRDLLTKSLARPRPQYSKYIQDWMNMALVSEERLAGFLSAFVSPESNSSATAPHDCYNNRLITQGDRLCQSQSAVI